ncbi:MAG: glycosyltransferase family 2 protein [Jannaschia sp.]
MSKTPSSGGEGHRGNGLRPLILCPTFDHTETLLFSVASVRAQTRQDWRMVIICDGSPPRAVDIARTLARDDSRISVEVHPKGERFGEAYRDQVIRAASEDAILHLGDDDIWAQDHLDAMMDMLADADWAISGMIGTPAQVQERSSPHWRIANPGQTSLRNAPGRRGFWAAAGINNVAYLREAYLSLPEGWSPSPEGVPSDCTMWKKFLSRPTIRTAASAHVTHLKLPSAGARGRWPIARRCSELGLLLARVNRPDTLQALRAGADLSGTLVRHFKWYDPPRTAPLDQAMALSGLEAVPPVAAAPPTHGDGPLRVPMTDRQRATADLVLKLFRAHQAGARKAIGRLSSIDPLTARRVEAAFDYRPPARSGKKL